MTGSLQIKGGVYYAVLSFKDESGKWKQKWICTELLEKNNRKKAKEFLEKTLSMYKNKTAVGNDVLFLDYMYLWLESMSGSIEDNTLQSYNDSIDRYIKPYFTKKKIKLAQLEPRHIQEFYTCQLKNGLSANSVLKQHANIRKALENAVRMNMIAYNPADRVELPKKKPYHANFYTSEQVNELLAIFKNEESYPAILLTAFYGLRRSEVLGLKWSHIDFTADTLTVQDTVVRCGNKAILDKPRTKNKASHRTLPLIMSLREYLLNLKQSQTEDKTLLESSYINNDYVCKRRNGEPFKPNYLSCRFGKVIRRAEMPHIRFHDLRHSAASMLLALGFSLKEIQEWLGHGTLSTTANIYAHLQFQAKQSMAKSIGEKLIFEEQ
jgi:integrase